jgi:predicted Rossmann fold nucleotide-binding protein DprA/Smf involved in DNA uptake
MSKPAICQRKGEANRYEVLLYGTEIFAAPYQAQMECLAADINTAIERHEACVAERTENNKDAVAIVEGMERRSSENLDTAILKALGPNMLGLKAICRHVKMPQSEVREALRKLEEGGSVTCSNGLYGNKHYVAPLPRPRG